MTNDVKSSDSNVPRMAPSDWSRKLRNATTSEPSNCHFLASQKKKKVATVLLSSHQSIRITLAYSHNGRQAITNQ